MRKATTDSPWPISSNPRAKYNDRGRADCNLNLRARLPLPRVFGRAVCDELIDNEVDDLLGAVAPVPDGRVPGPVVVKLFTYARDNTDLTRKGLDALGLPGVEPADMRQLDSALTLRISA